MNSSTSNSDKLFAWKALILLIILVIINFLVMELVARSKLSEIREAQKNSFVQGLASTSTSAYLGTSHTVYGWATLRSLNISLDLSGSFTIPPVMYYKVKEISKSPLIKTLFIEADHHLFINGPINKTDDLARWVKWFDEEGKKDILGQQFEENPSILKKQVSLESDISLIIHKRLVANFLQKPPVINTPESETVSGENPIKHKEDICLKYGNSALPVLPDPGSGTNDPPPKNLEEKKQRVLKRLSDFGLLRATELDPKMTGYYERMLKIAQEKKIDVYLVRYPATKLYYALMPQVIKDKTDEYLNYLKKKYSLTIIDLRTTIPDEYFWDQDHLFMGGSRMMGEQLLKQYCSRK